MKLLGFFAIKTSSATSRSATLLAVAALAWLCGVLGSLTACSKNGDPASSTTYRLPWPDENHEYKLRDVQVRSFSDPKGLSGQLARILVDPFVDSQGLQGAPIGRFIVTSDGVNVPADFDTLQGATIYAHVERLKELDEKSGVQETVKWPLTIGVSTNVYDSSGALRNNALYDGRFDALLFVPYIDTGLPISLNAGIIAHEHFHVVFQAMVLQKVKQKQVIIGKPSPNFVACHLSPRAIAPFPSDVDELAELQESETTPPRPRRQGRLNVTTVTPKAIQDAIKQIPNDVYNAYLMRAINEGFADFWAWVYTGQADFIGPSLPAAEARRRRLDLSPGRLPSVEGLRALIFDVERMKARSEDVRAGLAYLTGTQYARFLRQVAIRIAPDADKNAEARLRVGKALMGALPAIADEVAEKFADGDVSPNVVIKPLFEKLQEKNEPVCRALESFAAPGDDFTLPEACAEFLKDQPNGPTSGTAPTVTATPSPSASPTAAAPPSPNASPGPNPNPRSSPSPSPRTNLNLNLKPREGL